MCREEVASALNTGTKDSGASPNRVIVLCFYGKTLFPHGTSLHLGVNTGIAELLRPRDEFHGSPMSPSRRINLRSFTVAHLARILNPTQPSSMVSVLAL